MGLAWREEAPVAPALAQGRPLSVSRGATSGFWGNFAAAWLQGSGVNLSAEDALERLRQFNGVAAPPRVEGYSPFRDLDQLRGYEEDLHLFLESGSPDETAFIRRRIDRLRERARDLDAAGFWSQFLAGNLTPEALATMPLGIGRLGAMTQAGRAAEAGARMAALGAATAGGEAVVRDSQLPVAAQGNVALEMAFGALFGAALGSLAGALHPADVMRAARLHAERNDRADGFRTPGIEVPDGPGRVIRREDDGGLAQPAANENYTPAARRVLAEFMARRQADADALADAGRITRELADEAETPTPWLLDQVARGDLPEGVADLARIELRRRGIGESRFRLIRWLDDEGRRLDDFDTDPPAADGVNDNPAPALDMPEKSGVWQVFDESRGATVEIRSAADDLEPPAMDATGTPRRAEPPAPARLSEEDERALSDLEAEWQREASGAASPPGAGAPSSPPATPAPVAANQNIPPGGPAGAAPSAPAIPPAAMDGNRLAPAFGLEKARWTPFYVLANNRFTGTLGDSLARLAHRVVMTPGLRIRGNLDGSVASETGSVEALSRQHAARYLAAERAQREAYYRYRGWDPDKAGDLRSRAVEIKEAVAGGRPQGVMSFAEFDQAVGLALATGRGDADAVAAAKAWRDLFYDPMEAEGAAAGTLLVATHRQAGLQALQRERIAIELRLADVEKELRQRMAAGLRAHRAATGKAPDAARLEAMVREDPLGAAWLDERFHLQGEMRVNSQRADALSMAEPHPEPFVPHVWMKDRVREGREKLVGIVGDFWHAQAGHTWADAAIRAEVAIAHLMGEAVHETLERVLFRQFRLGGLAPDLAGDRAKALAQPVAEAMRRRSPGRVAKEVASAFGARLDPVGKAGIPQLVRDALTQAGVRGQVPQSPAQSTALGLASGPLPSPRPGAPDALDRLIGEIVDISKSAQGDRWADFNRPGHARQRTIDVPTERIAEFLDLSQRAGGLQYARRIGASIEMSHQFGDPSMLGELSRNRIEMLRAVQAGQGSLDELRAVDQAAKDLRDKVLGTFRIPEDPDAWSVRAIRLAQHSAIMAQMGMSVFSVMPDLGRISMAVGVQRVLRGIMEANPVWGEHFEGYRLAGREAELAGAASELALLGRASALLDIQHVGGDRTLIERVAQSGAETMQMVNLMAPATQLGQRFAGALLQSEMVELSVRLADGTIGAADLTRLRAYGLDDPMARRIAAEWRAAGGEQRGQLSLANTEAWQDRELIRRFRGALATAVDSAVMRPNVADRPNFMSAPIAQGMLLYKGFSIAASQRFLMAGLQQRDAYVLSGVISAVALAWLFQGPAGGAYDKHPILSLDRLVAAVERSGVTGLLSDVNQAVEMTSANGAGLRPLLGMQPPSFMQNPTWAQQAAVVGGPAVAPMLNVIWALTDPQARGDQRAGAIRRAIWFNNLIWWDWAVRGVTREIGTAIGNPPRPSGRPPGVAGFAGGGGRE